MLHMLLTITGAIPMQRRDDRGATTVEYALIAAGCAIALVGVVYALQTAVGGIFGATQTSMNNSVH